jgi:hypothetical protein
MIEPMSEPNHQLTRLDQPTDRPTDRPTTFMLCLTILSFTGLLADWLTG